MKKYHFYEDPGHGWLKVKKSELKILGIADKITSYSYMKGDNVFLEEDQDVTTFCNAKNILNFFSICVISHIANKQSKIRNYTPYENYTEDQEKEIFVLRDKILQLPINWSAKAIKQIKNADKGTLYFWKKYYSQIGYNI